MGCKESLGPTRNVGLGSLDVVRPLERGYRKSRVSRRGEEPEARKLERAREERQGMAQGPAQTGGAPYVRGRSEQVRNCLPLRK